MPHPPKDSDAPGGRWRLLAIVCALCTPVVLVYWNAMDGPFVLDDNDSVVRNRRIQVGDLSLASLGGALFAPPYVRRPLPNFTLALNYWAGGLSTRGYHLFNVAVHCMAALAMYWFLSRLLRDAQIARARAVAFGTSLLWPLNPVRWEPAH